VSNVEDVAAELGLLRDPPRGLSSIALTLAAGLDEQGPSLAMKSMAARELVVTMDRIRELAPPAREGDFVDDIQDEVAAQRDRVAKTKTRKSA
jgi:hypothetical protein